LIAKTTSHYDEPPYATRSNMKSERIEQLRARLQSKILHSLPMLTNTDYEDLLSLLDEKAAQMKAGWKKCEPCPFGPPSPAKSPGLSEADERALSAFLYLIEPYDTKKEADWLCSKGVTVTEEEKP
jgi:hypothetical protein